MAFDTIHETMTKDIMDVIKGVIYVADDFFSSKDGSKNVALTSSITKATKGLIMEFPVLVSKANHIESAGIVAKAYEAKFVTLLRMAFSAANLTNSKDAFDYLKNFHTNLDYDKITVDDFIGMMDNIVQHSSADISANSYAKYKAVTEDMRNLCYCFGDDINESSLNDYKVMDNYGRLTVVKEALGPYDPVGARVDDVVKSHEKMNQTFDTKRRETHNINQLPKDDSEKNKREELKDKRDEFRDQRNFLMNNLISSDVKKANEMAPTMIVINFVTGGEENVEQTIHNVIIGIKAKLYEVDPADVINKIIVKNTDSNVLLKLVKLSTREISFAKDFLFAIDDAKLDALSRSKRGSTNQLFKVLERRALSGKVRKMLKTNNYAKAISSLVISQEEAEELLKNNIDVNDPKVIRPIMERLNLISFAIIDESSESVRFIWDTGDDTYETIPLSKLEREDKDGMSRKVINLMAKMNR